MKTCLILLLGSLLFFASAAAANAQAQYTRPPAISPYRNLYNNGSGSPNQNYYNLVRPELDFRASIQQLQQQTRTNQQAISNLEATTGPVVTGHQAGFMTHRTYFQTLGAGGSGAAGAGFATVGGGGGGGT